MTKNITTYFFLMLVCCLVNTASAQSLLQRNISMKVTAQPVGQVLEILSNKGDFYFSYNSSIIPKDSLVSFSVTSQPVYAILGMMLDKTYEFKESGNYIIIRKAPIRMTMVTKKAMAENKVFAVSGFVYDEQSGIPITAASVYEKKMLAAAMTNNDGYFKVKLKSSKTAIAELTISKEWYADTTIVIEPSHNQELSITMMPLVLPAYNVVVNPRDYFLPDSLKHVSDTSNLAVVVDSNSVENTGLAHFLLSARQKLQSINLRHFFTARPVQVSLVPGISTHGLMSPQVVNHFSLNIVGGYNAGTNGLEIGGVFNIDKKDVKYVQAAGVFNIVGGQVSGVQVAGVNNTVLRGARGMQAAGVNNMVKGNLQGMQAAGVYNHVSGEGKGVQVAGVGNFSGNKMSGLQAAGVFNLSNKEHAGVQVSGVINYAKNLRGVQVGLINIADTSSGYSIGLINIVIKGYHKLGFSTNEMVNVNAAVKTGHEKLCSMLMAGVNTGNANRVYSFGYGIGSELSLNKKRNICFNPEASAQYLYLGSWDYINILNRLQLNLQLKLGKNISIFAGPAFSVYVSDQATAISGYHAPSPAEGYKRIHFKDKVSGWFGWNAGINFF